MDTSEAPAMGILEESIVDFDFDLSLIGLMRDRYRSQATLLLIQEQAMRDIVSEIQNSVVKIMENQPAVAENFRTPIHLLLNDPVYGTQSIGPAWEQIYADQKRAFDTFGQVTDNITDIQNTVVLLAEIQKQFIKATPTDRSCVVGKIAYICRNLYAMHNMLLEDHESSVKNMNMIRSDTAAILNAQVLILEESKQRDAELVNDLTRGAAWESMPEIQATTLALYNSVLSYDLPDLRDCVDTIVEIQEEARNNSNESSA